MVIGIIGMLVTIGLIVWQVFESKKSGLLRIAREEFEDRTVRYEGLVAYLNGPFVEYKENEPVYLSVIDGVICLTSKSREFHVIEGDAVQDVQTTEHDGGDVSLAVNFLEESTVQQLVVRGKAPRMEMIKRSIEDYATERQDQAIS